MKELEKKWSNLISKFGKEKGGLFYLNSLANFKIKFDQENIPVAGVCFQDRNITLLLGKQFWSKNYSDQNRIAILKHEVLHVLFLHFQRIKERNKTLWNIATDLAINCQIENIPEDALLPKKFSFENFLTAEDYYELLEKNEESNNNSNNQSNNNSNNQSNNNSNNQSNNNSNNQSNNNSNNQSNNNSNGNNNNNQNNNNNNDNKKFKTLDSHDLWDSMTSLERKFFEEKARELLESSLNQTSRSEIGHWIYDECLKAKNIEKKNWKEIISRIKSNLSKTKQKSYSWKRENRRFGNEVKGIIRRKNNSNLIFCVIDSSGSVKKEFIEESIGKIKSIYDKNDVKILYCDTKVLEIKNVKKFLKKPVRLSVGGTTMEEAMKYITSKYDKNEKSTVVFFTDGEIETKWSKEYKNKIYMIIPKNATCALKNQKYKVFYVDID